MMTQYLLLDGSGCAACPFTEYSSLYLCVAGMPITSPKTLYRIQTILIADIICQYTLCVYLPPPHPQGINRVLIDPGYQSDQTAM